LQGALANPDENIHCKGVGPKIWNTPKSPIEFQGPFLGRDIHQTS